MSPLLTALETALRARIDSLNKPHQGAVRLFNGFLEGCPDLVVEVYADTLVVLDHTKPQTNLPESVEQIMAFYQAHLPWLTTGLLKRRHSAKEQDRKGILMFGKKPATAILEQNVWYAIDLCLNQDTSFYLDTRNLRQWALKNLAGKRVLNTFAYTGSLGIAALSGGATQVIQTDRNIQFLSLAGISCSLNGFTFQRSDFRVGDFFPQIARLKKEGALFDCLFLDPPFFSSTAKGKVNLMTENTRLINKVRPLVAHNGWLVAVNNALFLSGDIYLSILKTLCADGYMNLETIIPVPNDCIGNPKFADCSQPADPSPFNHATKIAVLRILRKSKNR